MAELIVPELGESITEAVIGRWLKNVGDPIAVDEPVVDLETDKITVQLPSPVAGTMTEHRVAEGDTVHVGDVVGIVEVGEVGDVGDAVSETVETVEPAPAAPSAPAASVVVADTRATSPAASVLPPAVAAASAHRLSPAQRRAQRDGQAVAIPAAIPAAIPVAIPVAMPAAAATPAPVTAARKAVPVSSDPREEVVAMSPLRKRIAQRLVQAQQSSASLTTFNEVDMSAIMALRKTHQEAFVARHGIKLGFMSFFVKAAVSALKAFPGLNAEMRGDAIAYKKFYDIGIAVSTERGLVVPVLRGCDALSFADIEHGIAELAGKARDGKLQLSDLAGASFTVTNGGIFGSMLSTPLLNFPQTGILGMHNIVRRPVAVGDSIELRPIMYVAVTYDHRVVDGRESVQFLVALKQRLESPDRLLFDL